jgi:hypothetical protein
MLRGLREDQRFSSLKAAGLRWGNVPTVPNYVDGNSTRQTALLGVRSVFNGASPAVQDPTILPGAVKNSWAGQEINSFSLLIALRLTGHRLGTFIAPSNARSPYRR